jgi:hypothetical protein
MPDDSELEGVLAALRREFAAGLPTRLAALRLAHGTLRRDASAEALRAFHLPAHALAGTAGAYDAHELEPHVMRLLTLARGWVTAGAAPGAEWEAAARELDLLEAGIARYRDRVG